MAGTKGKSGRKSRAEEGGLKAILDRAWPTTKRISFFIKLAEMAEGGNLEAGKLLAAYTFGKPTENHTVTGVQEIRIHYGGSDETGS